MECNNTNVGAEDYLYDHEFVFNKKLGYLEIVFECGGKKGTVTTLCRLDQEGECPEYSHCNEACWHLDAEMLIAGEFGENCDCVDDAGNGISCSDEVFESCETVRRIKARVARVAELNEQFIPENLSPTKEAAWYTEQVEC
jgi:hypothetical protein